MIPVDEDSPLRGRSKSWIPQLQRRLKHVTERWQEIGVIDSSQGFSAPLMGLAYKAEKWRKENHHNGGDDKGNRVKDSICLVMDCLTTLEDLHAPEGYVLEEKTIRDGRVIRLVLSGHVDGVPYRAICRFRLGPNTPRLELNLYRIGNAGHPQPFIFYRLGFDRRQRDSHMNVEPKIGSQMNSDLAGHALLEAWQSDDEFFQNEEIAKANTWVMHLASNAGTLQTRKTIKLDHLTTESGDEETPMAASPKPAEAPYLISSFHAGGVDNYTLSQLQETRGRDARLLDQGFRRLTALVEEVLLHTPLSLRADLRQSVTIPRSLHDREIQNNSRTLFWSMEYRCPRLDLNRFRTLWTHVLRSSPGTDFKEALYRLREELEQDIGRIADSAGWIERTNLNDRVTQRARFLRDFRLTKDGESLITLSEAEDKLRAEVYRATSSRRAGYRALATGLLREWKLRFMEITTDAERIEMAADLVLAAYSGGRHGTRKLLDQISKAIPDSRGYRLLTKAYQYLEAYRLSLKCLHPHASSQAA
jgi:hypothetical protein